MKGRGMVGGDEGTRRCHAAAAHCVRQHCEGRGQVDVMRGQDVMRWQV